MAALSKRERAELATYEGILEAAYGDIAPALQAIHKKRLYREHGSFESYVEERWGISRARAYQLINQGKVSTNVGAAVPEAHARELAAVKDDKQGEVLAAAGGVDATAARIRELLAAMPPKQQAEVVRRFEAGGRQAAVEVGRRDRVESIEGYCRKLRKVHAGLTDVADAADLALDKYLQVIRGSTE